MAECAGRFIGGVVAGNYLNESHAVKNLGIFVCGIAIIVIPFCQMYNQFMFCVMISGMTIGPLTSLTPVILAEEFGLENLTTSFSMLRFLRGVETILSFILFRFNPRIL